jgi:hypothetical protein
MKIKFTFLIVFYLILNSAAFGQLQNSLSFDGTDDNVIVPAGSSLIVNSTEISLTCWVYPTDAFPSWPNYDGFAGIRNDTSADFYMVQTAATQLEARYRGSSGITYTINYFGLQLNAWQLYAFTYDGNQIRLYKDGVAVDSLAASGTITDPTVDFLVGDVNYTGTHFYLHGELDEISFWSRKLSEEEIHCIYLSEVDSLSAGLQLYYKCNEGIAGANNSAFTTLYDAAHHIDGTLQMFALTGNFSNYVAGVSNYTFASDSICPGDLYVFGTQTLTTAGIYYATYQSAQGCDSTIELNLSVKSLDTTVVQSGVTLTAVQAGAAYQWINCNGNTAIAGAVNNSYTATVNGSYAVVISTNGCSDTSACHTINSVGIAEQSNNSLLNIYPSPVSDDLIIEMPLTKNVHISIYNMTGEKITDNYYTSFQKIKMDTRSWKGGVYYLQCQSGDKLIVNKILKIIN